MNYDENTREGRHLTPEERIALQAEEIKQLQQENERLADETIKLMKENAKNSNKKDELVKVLKQARKALYAARVDVLTKETDELAREALAEIDKVMGGKKW